MNYLEFYSLQRPWHALIGLLFISFKMQILWNISSTETALYVYGFRQNENKISQWAGFDSSS